MSESGRMIYRVNTEYAQIELFHEAGDTEPYEIIELDEAVHIYQSLVRCQDCKYWVYNFNGCSRNPCTEPWYATDFCNYGERSRR